MSAMCPSCGYNLKADEPVEIGDWRIVPREGAFFRDQLAFKRHSWTDVLLALARESGRSVATEMLLARISDSERNNTLSSQLSQMRRHLKAKGIPCPISSKTGRDSSYWWVV